MDARQFDSNAAFASSGFMPSRTTHGAGSCSKNCDSQTVTIKQINDIFNTVTLVGRVCNKAQYTTHVNFVLDDGTGKIECTKGIQEAADSIEMEGILNGTYVRIHGRLNGFQRNLHVFCISRVTDFNEIAHHFLDGHLCNLSLQNIEEASIPKGYQAQFSVHHQKSIDELVFDVLHLSPNREMLLGVSFDSIAEQLGISSDKLRPAIRNLIEKGEIYEGTTNHYKLTMG